MLVGGFKQSKNRRRRPNFGEYRRLKKQQSNRAEKGASRSEDELDEGANGVVRVQQVLHQAPIRGAQPGPAALQGDPQNNQKLLPLLFW